MLDAFGKYEKTSPTERNTLLIWSRKSQQLLGFVCGAWGDSLPVAQDAKRGDLATAETSAKCKFEKRLNFWVISLTKNSSLKC